MNVCRGVVAVLVACAGCFSGHALGGEQLVAAGSSTIQPILEQASKEYKKGHPEIDIVVSGGGSGHGVKGVVKGELNIGAVSRDLTSAELADHKDLVATRIGLDGIALLVHADNPVTSITSAQVQDIYTGKITNWKEVGGNDAPIVLISKDEGRSTLELFLHHFGLEPKFVGEGAARTMVFRKKGAPEYGAAAAKPVGQNKDVISAISTKPTALGYASIGTAEAIVGKGGSIKLLTLDGCKASVANVSNETYPFRRPLNLVTKGAPQGSVKAFVDFVLGADGQKIVAGLEFVPVAK